MSEIDWDEAPEWADKYGAAGPQSLRVWFNKDQYVYFDDAGRKPLRFGDTEAFARDRDQFTVIAERPSPAWSGDGLPPVGLRCEAAIPHTSGPDNERSFIWIEGSVIAYYEIKGKTYAWFAEDDGFYPPNVLEFRPIRTPEQIAADEREQALREACEIVGCAPGSMYGIEVVNKLIDAGYRKQEQPK